MAYAPTRDSELPAVRLPAAPVPGQAALLTPGALAFLTELHRRFEPARQARLSRSPNSDIPPIPRRPRLPALQVHSR